MSLDVKKMINTNIQMARYNNEDMQEALGQVQAMVEALPSVMKPRALKFIETVEGNMKIRNSAIERLEKMANTKFKKKEHDEIIAEIIMTIHSDDLAIEFYNSMIAELKC